MQTKNKPHHNTGKQNALKDKEHGELCSAKVIFMCRTSQKSAWVESAKANGQKLTEWIIDRLGKG